jgi:transcription antitermination factor NusG
LSNKRKKQTWHIVSLEPSAARKATTRRFYWGPRNGRHSTLERHDESNLERTCRENGVDIYFPFVRFAYLDRSQRPAHGSTPLIPGFAFVSDITDFQALKEVPGIVDVLRNNGVPIPMATLDMIAIEKAHAQATVEFHKEWSKMNLQRHKLTKKQMRQTFRKGARFRIRNGIAAGYGRIKDVTTRNTVKMIHEKLLGVVEVPIDDIEFDDNLREVA